MGKLVTSLLEHLKELYPEEWESFNPSQPTLPPRELVELFQDYLEE